MSSARIYKSAVLEDVTGINAVTVRSWRRKGHLKSLGFEATGKMTRYSLVDMCVFAVTVELIQAGVEMPLALLTAIEMHDAIAAVVSSRQKGGQIEIVGLDEDTESYVNWTGFAVLQKSKLSGHYYSNVVRSVDGLALSFALQDSKVVLVIDIGQICQNVAQILLQIEGSET